MATLRNQLATTNGTTPVAGVTAPTGSLKFELLGSCIDNKDDIDHTFYQRWKKTTGSLVHSLPELVVQAGKAGLFQGVAGLVLLPTDESYEVVMKEAKNSVDPTVLTAFFEV
jgi:hypothetical protein